MNFVSPETAVETSAAEAELGALLSITRRMNGFLYRCQNDPSYTMLYITDGITPLTEYPASDFIGNRVRAFTSICHPDDLGVVDKAVGAALESKTNWDIDYRLVGRNGKPVWINEIGGGVFDENGELKFLEGCIVSIADRKALEVQNRQVVDHLGEVQHPQGARCVEDARLECAHRGDPRRRHGPWLRRRRAGDQIARRRHGRERGEDHPSD
jgi:hypothetical protein